MFSPEAPILVRSFAAELFDGNAPRRISGLLGWSVAVGVHALVFGLALSEQRAPSRVPAPLEIEIAPRKSAPAASPPVVPPPAPDAPRPQEHTRLVRAAAAPPEPARAGALLTAKADPEPTQPSDDLIDFTHDPSVLGFGSGIVAVGGNAHSGAANAQQNAASSSGNAPGVAPRSGGDALTPASDLSRQPSFGESDPCRGYFPNAATDDVATTTVLVTIGKNGSVSKVQLLSEAPPKQGFGAAARACLMHKRFTPGLDRAGNPAATVVRVNIRFTR